MKDAKPPGFLEITLHENGRIRRITCKECLRIVCEDIALDATEGHRIACMKGVAIHLEINHDAIAFYGHCGDEDCSDVHLAVYMKKDLSKEQLRAMEQVRNLL